MHSAQASGANDESAEPDGQSGTGATRGPSDETIEATNGFYRPIPIPAEFAGLDEREGHLSEFHARLEREPEDPEWALPLERELEDFLNELLDSALINVKLIKCRSDSCEILAVGYGEQANKEWLNLAPALYESGLLEKWFKIEEQGQFNGGCGARDLAPGVVGLSCQFSSAAPRPADAGSRGNFSLSTPYPDGVEFTLVPVPDDFVPLYETNAEVYDFHRALQLEAVDHSWAPFIENQIIEHFSAIPELESVNYHHIACRTTRCAVQLTIHDPQAAIPWSLELGKFNNQPWIDLEFKVYNVSSDDDLIRILLLLNRNTGN